MGAGAALRALAVAEESGKAGILVSVGWAGALDAAFAAGKAFPVAMVVDADSGQRFPMAGGEGGCLLVSNALVADAGEKRRLAAVHGPGLVDMEAAALAAVARRRGIPMRAVKGVSDAFKQSLPDFNPFIREGGRFDLAAFVLYSLPRPALWPALLRLGIQGGRSARAMAGLLKGFLQGLQTRN
jgi:nucleoside phosphorylase